MLGIVPGSEEVLRLVLYLLVSVLYISFWLGISILFSVIFKSTSTSALAALAVWIFSSFLVPLRQASFRMPSRPSETDESQPNVEAVMKHEEVQRIIFLFSPTGL